ncbi:superoxide dismutase, Ni [Thiosocius teredinicola]|uniref:superoxide dismutase, Ni n=1 Tax=Thiosocius teredinicola TaxID=1973002 RepID=UPI002FE4E856
MSRSLKSTLLAAALSVASFNLMVIEPAQAHCQIPCGIYDDHARVQSMLEDAATVEKSVTLITELAGKTDVQSQNQLVRWVMNKETHAQKIIATISDYFLTQRVKADMDDYGERLAKHHAVIVAAMKAKQNADDASVKALKDAIEALAPYYPEHKH